MYSLSNQQSKNILFNIIYDKPGAENDQLME